MNLMEGMRNENEENCLTLGGGKFELCLIFCEYLLHQSNNNITYLLSSSSYVQSSFYHQQNKRK